MAESKHRRIQDIVEQSRYWDAQDLLRNLEDEMRRLEQGLGHFIFDSEGRPMTICVSPLPLTPKFETRERPEEFILMVHLPDVEKEDVRLYVNRNSIEVRAVSGQKTCRPLYLGVYTPWSVDSERSKAEFDDGILTVRAKKLKKTRVKVR